jgi:hypothetical protein
MDVWDYCRNMLVLMVAKKETHGRQDVGKKLIVWTMCNTKPLLYVKRRRQPPSNRLSRMLDGLVAQVS